MKQGQQTTKSRIFDGILWDFLQIPLNKRLEGSAMISSLLFWFIFFSRRPNGQNISMDDTVDMELAFLVFSNIANTVPQEAKKPNITMASHPPYLTIWESWSVPIGLLPPLRRWVPLLASSSWHHMACESQEHRCELCPPNTWKIPRLFPRNLRQDRLNGARKKTWASNSSIATYLGVCWEGPIQILMDCWKKGKYYWL